MARETGQGPAPQAGGPAEVTGDGQDPFARLHANPRLAVQCEGHRALGDARDPGDIGDGGAFGFH